MMVRLNVVLLVAVMPDAAPAVLPLPTTVTVSLPALLLVVFTEPPSPQPDIAESPIAISAKIARARNALRRRKATRKNSEASVAAPERRPKFRFAGMWLAEVTAVVDDAGAESVLEPTRGE